MAPSKDVETLCHRGPVTSNMPLSNLRGRCYVKTSQMGVYIPKHCDCKEKMMLIPLELRHIRVGGSLGPISAWNHSKLGLGGNFPIECGHFGV